MAKLIHGVGFNDGKYPTRAKGKDFKEYKLWSGVLERCFSPPYHVQKPSYIGCTISENFKSYSYFYDWCQQQVGFGQKGYHLDKDLLLKGNKIYSEDLCVFIPRDLNVLLTSCAKVRGELPVGVTRNGCGYMAQLSVFKKHHYLGTFKTSEEAFQVYKAAKESHIKHMAELYKAEVDFRVYTTLMAYQVEVTD